MRLGFHIYFFPGDESELSRLRLALEKSEERRIAETNKLSWQVKHEREKSLTTAEKQKKCAASLRKACENLQKQRILREVGLERMTAHALKMSEGAARAVRRDRGGAG